MKRSKHGLLVFPPKKTLIWRRHCLTGQSCCSMTSKRIIDWFLESSRAWSFFSPERSLNQPKATRVCIRSINQSNPSISVLFLFLFCSHIFISRSYEIALTLYKPSIYMQILQTDLHTFPWRIRGYSLFKNPRIFPQPFFDYVLILWWQNWCPTSIFS